VPGKIPPPRIVTDCVRWYTGAAEPQTPKWAVACALSTVDDVERLIRYVPSEALAVRGYVMSGGMSPPNIGEKFVPV
jgi:hypothetical protein